MEAGLMEIVLLVNRSWIDDAYFSLYKSIHPGEKSGRKCPGGNARIPNYTCPQDFVMIYSCFAFRSGTRSKERHNERAT